MAEILVIAACQESLLGPSLSEGQGEDAVGERGHGGVAELHPGDPFPTLDSF
jgi:hypothetical protein